MTMRKILIISITLLFISCSPMQKVKFGDSNDAVRFKMSIPKGYELFRACSSYEEEFVYNYPDSSILYLSSFGNANVNYDNVRQQGTYYKLFEAQVLHQDSLNLEGVDEKGAYWRNICIGRYEVGYSNVDKNKKDFYDRILATLIVRRN